VNTQEAIALLTRAHERLANDPSYPRPDVAKLSSLIDGMENFGDDFLPDQVFELAMEQRQNGHSAGMLVLTVTGQIATAAVNQNTLHDGGAVFLAFVEKLHKTLIAAHFGVEAVADKAPAVAPLVPAVTIEESVQPDYIVCLEDGKKFKLLKRHISAHYGLTPDQYRQRWGLPASYPMVAPNYSAARSQLAKDTGLGKRGRQS